MKRRDFSLAMTLVGAGSATLPQLASALAPAPPLRQPAQAPATEVIEGRDFTMIKPAVSVDASGKIEVAEFFGYWCPHCFALEPALESWLSKMPKTVVFRRVPVAFSSSHDLLQQMYFALDSMGQLQQFHPKVFEAVHSRKMKFNKESDIAGFAAAYGIDANKLLATMKSFSVSNRCRQAKQMTAGFGIDSVPTLAVQGKYKTAPHMVGGADRVFAVVEQLVKKG
jgi:protein dithiol oxidoreductase (disulfide-forming)